MNDLLQEKRVSWRKRYAAELLTQEQVNKLPTGTIVEIIWSGCNNPYQYVVQRDEKHGCVFAWTDRDPDRQMRHQITIVGSERYQTQVRLVENPVQVMSIQGKQ
jgi:hypothetical protein